MDSPFDEFRYDTISVTGSSGSAAIEKIVNDFIASIVDQTAAEDSQDCSFEDEQVCGQFVLTARPEACDSYLCLQIDIGGVHVGAATSDEATYALVFDPQTGARLSISDVYGKDLNAAIKATVKAWQADNGYYPGDFKWSFKDITGWRPEGDGVHVWFTKYAVGSGAEGAVEITVPYPGTGSVKAALVPSLDAAVEWLCEVYDVESLPWLKKSVTDTFEVSAVQYLLVALGYPSGGMPVDGDFGSVTQRAVRAFQSDNGLVVDGQVGPQTWDALQWGCEDSGDVGTADGSQGPPAQPAAPAPPAQQPQPQGVQVPNVIGARNRDAESAISRSGLGQFSRYTNGDPSLSAQVQNLCQVVDQAPRGGSIVARGTVVTLLVDCPLTGQAGSVGGWNGPPPPPAWTGQ